MTDRQPESEAEYAAFDQIGEDATDVARSAADRIGIEGTIAGAHACTVRSDQDLVLAAEYLSQLQGALRLLEAARVALVKPLNDHVCNINQVFKDKRTPLDQTIADLKSRVSDYHYQKEREAAEIEAKLQAEQRAAQEAAELLGSAPAPEVAIERPRTAGYATSGSARVKHRWTYEVESLLKLVEAAARAPDKYLGLLAADRGALKRAVDGGLREIPGVHIEQVADVEVKRNAH